MDKNHSRRNFLRTSLVAGVGLSLIDPFSVHAMMIKSKMKMGLVTYQWGKDWDLPTLISNCEKTGFLGVELRTQHAHGVETSLTADQRTDVKKRFADSPVNCIGYGSNFDYHHVDQAVVRRNIEGTKEYLNLCKDIGATGIKVKPNGLPKKVSKEKTIAQINEAKESQLSVDDIILKLNSSAAKHREEISKLKDQTSGEIAKKFEGQYQRAKQLEKIAEELAP